MSGWPSKGHFGGLQLINGKDVFNAGKGNPTTVRGNKVTNGKIHEIKIQVQTSGVTAKIEVDLDGKSFARWSGKQASLSMLSHWKIPSDHLFGLGIWIAEVEFHEVKLRMLSGKAIPWEESPAKQDR